MATLIVVRRDATATFQHLRETWAEKLGSHLTLLWDRRTSDRRRDAASIPVERRVSERREAEAKVPDDLDEARRGERRQQAEWRMPERRQAERRRHAPETWQTLGFVLVSQTRPTSDAAPGEVIE